MKLISSKVSKVRGLQPLHPHPLCAILKCSDTIKMDAFVVYSQRVWCSFVLMLQIVLQSRTIRALF